MSRIEVKALPTRRFDARPIGRKVELRISHRYADARLSQLEEELNSILSQIPGLEDLALEIAPKDGWIAFRFNEGEWVNIIPLDDLKGEKGEDGKEVSISIDGFILKWRLGTAPWVNLIDLSTLGYFKKQDFSDEFQEDGEGKMEVKEISATKIKGKDKDEEVYDIQTAVNNLLEQSLTIDDFNSTQFELDPSDKVTLKEGGLPIYVDNTTITGAGTQQDPYKAEGGGGFVDPIVSDPVTPDFTPVVQGDNFQQVTNKVAGLQLKTLVDYTLTSPQHTIEFTKDDSGKPLTIYKSIIILVDIIGFQDEIGDAQNSRVAIRFNDITTGYDWGTNANRDVIHINSGSASFQKGMVLLQINSNGFIGFSVANAQSFSLINKQVVEPIVKVSFNTFNPTRLASIGSRIVILGQ